MMTTVDDFVLGRQLGVGTYGETYEAIKGGKRFALKLIRADAMQMGFDVQRFNREVRSLEKATGRNVVKLLDYGEASIGNEKRYYLVLEYLDGFDLAKTFERAMYAFNEATLKSILMQVVQGLDTIHAQDIVHRDLKPANIFVLNNGEVKLLDFGLVKMLDYTTLTVQPGQEIGTPLYIAPEILRGEPGDTRADFYSLGVLMYYLVTGGKYPFWAQTKEELYFKVLNTPPTLPTSNNEELSLEFEELILALLCKQPFQRTFTHQEIIERIRLTPLAAQRTKVVQLTFGKEQPKRCLFHLLPTEKGSIMSFLDSGNTIDGAFFQASYLPRNRKMLEELQVRQVPVAFDPVTYRLAYSSFAQTKGLRELPYVPDVNSIVTQRNFQTLEQIQKYARSVIDWQVECDCSMLVAPFHFARDLQSGWIDIDIKLIEESKRYASIKAPGRPVYGGICAGLEAFTVPENRLALLNRYSRTRADGYIFFMDGFDEKINNPLLVRSYFHLLDQFQQAGVNVFAARVGTIGLGFLAAGISGVTNGIASLTSFSEATLLINRDIDYEIPPKYYLPALMLNLPLEVAADVLGQARYSNLRCQCPFCKSGITRASSKLHFLSCRTSEIAELNKMLGTEERITWFRNRTLAAYQECDRLRKDGIIHFKTSAYAHLRIWLDVFQLSGVA